MPGIVEFPQVVQNPSSTFLTSLFVNRSVATSVST